MRKTPRSFIRETLKVTEHPDIISFAGGLPNPSVFPVQELAKTAEEVIREDGPAALQYATTEDFCHYETGLQKGMLTGMGFRLRQMRSLLPTVPSNVLI